MPKTLQGSSLQMLLILWRQRLAHWTAAANMAANGMDCVLLAECQAHMQAISTCIKELEEHFEVDTIHRN